MIPLYLGHTGNKILGIESKSNIISIYNGLYTHIDILIVCVQDKALLQSMFDTPKSDIVAVHVDEETVRGKKEAKYIRAQAPAEETEPIVEAVAVENDS